MRAAATDIDGNPFVIRLVALSYRGYWTSKGSPSQAGIELDTEAAISWVLEHFNSPDTKIVLWGQSIGAGVASLAAASLARSDPASFRRVSGLLLETPFVDLRAMLVALYPQKYLPYRYLTPFLMSIWDSKAALESIGSRQPPLQVSLLQAGNDEIVPDGQAAVLKEACSSQGMHVVHHIVPGALHQEVMMKPRGRKEIVAFLQSL